jgi:YgiT-type zinc finger domain-containing protein
MNGLATIPFVLGKLVAVIKDVPAEVCDTCGEPFLHAAATDTVTALLARARTMGAEVTVLTYGPPTDAAA